MVRRRDSLADVGEFGFLRRLLPTLAQTGGVLVGPGDDCAVVRGDCAVVRGAARTLLTTDALVEGVHFERHWLTPEEIGARAILVNLSDIAAMGGRARFALLSVGVPPDLRRADLARLHRGADRAARGAGAAIVGGNLSASDTLFVSVALVGTAARPALRSGAGPGDLVFVTGTFGDAATAVQLLGARASRRRARGGGGGAGRRDVSGSRRHVGFLLRRFAAPTPRLETGASLADARVVSAMIDVSDGLTQDLGHVCESSGVGAVVFEDNVPRSAAYEGVVGPDPGPALHGGEDYELLFTVPRARLERFERLRRRLPDRVSFVGEIVARPRGVRLCDRGGRLRRPEKGGFEHFRPA